MLAKKSAAGALSGFLEPKLLTGTLKTLFRQHVEHICRCGAPQCGEPDGHAAPANDASPLARADEVIE
ncbi:MAG: hypothetical protein C5B58_10240 [Acidobacteria bacterium]|nr:MAG: hypothetical protein C5B58_10240 [Acidobacteriota bacterium]